MAANTIMFQGTASDVGKSVLTSALCRILARDGYKVAPFKSQNMALNSFITKDGVEIGRAQAVQAEAAMTEPTVNMNPILLKPNGDNNSQVIFRGKAYKNMTAKEYFSHQDRAYNYIEEALKNLSCDYDLIVMEGGGSPAEVNLRENDLVNMSVAEIVDSPVILIADIDKGGVFASVIGTLELLEKEEADRIKGIIINKFRGDKKRFRSGVNFIEEYTEKPVLGVIPFAPDIDIPDEDSLYQKQFGEKEYDIDIAVIYLPHISNFTDFDYLSYEPGVNLRYVKDKSEIGSPDLVIIPGSKNTIGDLKKIYKKGIVEKIKNLVENGTPVIGICGGYQILGRTIEDPLEIEMGERVEGIGLLDIKTTLEYEKVTEQITAVDLDNLPFSAKLNGNKLKGYEIHQGKTEHGSNVSYLFRLERNDSNKAIDDGAINKAGTVWGTYIHDIFKNDRFRRELVNYLREKKGLNPLTDENLSIERIRDRNYNRFADLVKDNLDIEKLYDIIFNY